MLKRVFLIISTLLMAYLGWEFYQEYMVHHTYYYRMMESWTNRKVVLALLISASLPTIYLLNVKKKGFWTTVAAILIGMFVYIAAHIGIKSAIVGGFIKLLFNVIVLWGLALFAIMGFTMVGERVKHKLLGLKTATIMDVIINMGCGLAVFLVINYVLVISGLLYPLVSWMIVLATAAGLYLRREKLAEMWEIVNSVFESDLFGKSSYHPVWGIIYSLPAWIFVVASFVQQQVTIWVYLLAFVCLGLLVNYVKQVLQTGRYGLQELFSADGLKKFLIYILLLLSFGYIFNGVNLAFLPYSTAWDANHAYMFYPKMWAFNHGYHRSNIAMGSSVHLWYMFITFWFSLFIPTNGIAGIAGDTIAIQMNFWSGVYVLLFGLGLLSEIISYLRSSSQQSERAIDRFIFILGWLLLIAWLSSGMGAFLVFIDNKTDLGVLALIILALYSGFYFFREEQKFSAGAEDSLSRKQLFLLVGLSGFFYGIAALAKPTALFDVVNFGLFMWWNRLGWIGAIGLLLMVLAVMILKKLGNITNFFPTERATYLGVAGGVGLAGNMVHLYMKKAWKHMQYILVRGGVFFAVLVVVKLPFMIAKQVNYGNTIDSPGKFIERLIFGASDTDQQIAAAQPFPTERVLLAQASGALPTALPVEEEEVAVDTGSVEEEVGLEAGAPENTVGPVEQCALTTQGFSSVEELYDVLPEYKSTSYNEDVGRYIGFGWKGNPSSDQRRGVYPFMDPRWASHLGEGCHGFGLSATARRDAKVLCTSEADWKGMSADGLQRVHAQLSAGGRAAEKVANLLEIVTTSTEPVETLKNTHSQDIQEIESYMQGNAIKIVTSTEGRQVFVPYNYLSPFNISFNRSLQNLSSYYTDIGVVWIMLFVFLFMGLLYGLLAKRKELVSISAVVLFGRLLWWVAGGGILWYAIGVVIWTILAFIFYIYYLVSDEEKSDLTPLSYLFLTACFIFVGIQVVFNYVRIASQGGGGAFVRYKMNYGQEVVYNDALQPVSQITAGYGAEEVFERQFPHYRKFMHIANERPDNVGFLIAGTYLRYFIEDQSYVKDDQFLGRLYEMFSDGDVCNAYLRLKNENLKYLVIDPNIGTVVQGAGNQSLFDRFLAKVDPISGTVEQHGTLSMLAAMAENGYIKYISSNNLGAKYALIMPENTFGGITAEQVTLLRARMMAARFFGEPIITPIVDIAMQRVADGTFVTDMADVQGLVIRDEVLLEMIQKGALTAGDLQALTADEKQAMAQFLGLRQLSESQGEAALRQQLQSIIQQSIGGGNQLIVVELTNY